MRKNKALTPFFAVLLLLWIQVLDVGAATGNYEARIGTTYYNTLESAVGAAATGDTVEILSDVVLEATLVVDKGITITTDGIADRTISGTPSSNNYLINVKTLASVLSGANAHSCLIVDGSNLTHSRALVCLQAADSRMHYVTIQNNVSTYSGGGGLYTNKTGIVAEDCVISNNSCTGSTGGGGIYLTGTAEMTMRRCTVSGNSATASGGGIFVAAKGVLSADRSTISNNSALIKGGAVKVNGQFHPTGCAIFGNTAPSDGSSSLLLTLPSFQGRLLGYVDGSDGQQEAVYQVTANGDTYGAYLEKLTSAGYVLRRTEEIDGNTYSVFTDSSKTVTLMDTPRLKDGTVRILIEDAAILPNLNSQAGVPVNTPTVSMLGTGSPTSQNGMCFIYQLSDGRFILVDGGYPTDADQIYDTLKALSGNSEVTIAAWFLTHAHNDHVAAFESFWRSDNASHVTLEKIICNFPGMSTFGENIITKPQSTTWMARVQDIIDSFPSSVERIKAHPGQVYCIGDATITMLYSAELMSPDEVWNFNDTSLIFTVELGGTKFLQLADCAKEAGNVLTEIYSSELVSDVLQVAHHGHYNNSVGSDLYKAVSADYAFWPSTEERYNWEENRNAEANIWLFNQQQSGCLTMWCAGNYIRTFQIQNRCLSILPVASIDNVNYATLDEAVLAAQDGDTVTLTRPCVIRNGGVQIDKSLTLRTDAGSPCYIYGTLIVGAGKTLTLSGGIAAKEIRLESSALIHFSGIINQDKITTLNLGSFSNVKHAQVNQTVCLTGDISENYQRIELLNNVNPDDSTEKYMLYASGKVIKAGEAAVGNTVYSSLEQAVASASAGSTVTIIADVHLADQLKIQKSLTLATDGFCDRTITSNYTDGYALFVTGSSSVNIAVQLRGSDHSRLIVDGEGAVRAKSLLCSNYATTTMANVTICNGNSTFAGAGLYVTQGSANLSGCHLIHNTTSDSGGGSYITSTGSITMNQCQVLNNHASYGGGIYGANSSGGKSASITIVASLLEDNSAGNRGGGIYGNGDSSGCCNVIVQGSTFRRNSADTATNGAGGAVCMVGSKADIVITESTFENNSASAFGGAVTTSSSNGKVTLGACTFAANTAGGSSLGGGAVCCGTLVVQGGTTTITENVAETSNGGAICFQNVALTVDSDATLLLSGNTAFAGLGNDLYFPANGSIAVNGDVGGIINLYVENAGAGSTVLTGSNVAQCYTQFTFGDGSLSIASNGTLISA